MLARPLGDDFVDLGHASAADLIGIVARVTDQVTTTVMSNPQVKDAIDAAVGALPPRLQQFKPTVESGVRSLVSAGVGRLLTSDPFRPLTQAALTSAGVTHQMNVYPDTHHDFYNDTGQAYNEQQALAATNIALPISPVLTEAQAGEVVAALAAAA